jgi:hypothetical protein
LAAFFSRSSVSRAFSIPLGRGAQWRNSLEWLIRPYIALLIIYQYNIIVKVIEAGIGEENDQHKNPAIHHVIYTGVQLFIPADLPASR